MSNHGKIDNGKKNGPSQARLNQIRGDRIHSPEQPVTADERRRLGEARHRSEAGRAGPEEETVPGETEEDVESVEIESIGRGVEAAVGPDEPGGGAHEEAGGEGAEIHGGGGGKPEGFRRWGGEFGGVGEEVDGEEGEGNGDGDGDG